MPLILYSYLLTEILAVFFAALLILSGVLFTGRLMQVVDLIFTMNIGLADFIRLSAYLAPNPLLFSVPMASTLAVIIAFVRLNSDNEMIALKAAGISLYKMLPPVVVFALSTSLLTGFFSIQLIPAGTIAMKGLFFKLATERINKGLQEKRFSENTGDIVVYIDKIDPKTQKWKGVYLSDLRDQKNPVTVLARSGSLTPHLEKMYMVLDFKNGSMHRSDQETSQTIKFERYRINMPVRPPKFIDGESTSLVTKNVLSQKGLLEYADLYGHETINGVSFLVEYQKRLVLPVGCFILTMLGLPLAMRRQSGSRNIGIPLGLFFFILYYVMVSWAKGMCDTATLPIPVIMWTPNVIFGVFTATVFSITAAEKWDSLKKLFGR